MLKRILFSVKRSKNREVADYKSLLISKIGREQFKKLTEKKIQIQVFFL